MATEIIMPKLGLTMTEGTVDIWLKKEGDSVEKGEAVCTISSEKLTHDVEAPESGILTKIIVAQGEEIPCQKPIGVIGSIGEETTATEPAAVSKEKSISEIKTNPKKTSTTKPQKATEITEKRIFITPLAKKIATEKNYNIAEISGTGGNGRITKRDIELYQPAPNQPETQTRSSTAGAGLTGMRKIIAQRMMGSLQNTAQVTIHQKADLTKLMLFRKELKEKADIPLIDGQMSITTLLAKAVVLALKDSPAMNSWYQQGKLTELREVHLGIAVALPQGLVVPVIQNADKMTLTQLGKSSQDLIERTKNGTLDSTVFKGSTFTISNLGKSGVEYFTPILNGPETGILGVGSLLSELALDAAGNIIQKQKLPLSLTFDHQIIDGSPAAEFLGKVIHYLEYPYSLLL